MSWIAGLVSLLLLVSIETGLSLDISKCEILDMAHPLAADNPHYPTHKKFNFTLQDGRIGKEKVYVAWGYLCSSEHMSTHMDAPSHFVKGGATADEVSFKNLVGEACVIDVKEKVKKNSSYGLTIQDVKDFEAANGIIPSNAILLMDSGWDANWYSAEKFLGTNNVSDAASFKYPSFSPELGEWLVNNRRLRAFGVDVLSFDMPSSKTSPNHQALLSAGLPGMENLKNLGKLPPRGATIFLPATKIKGGTGAWVRAFAVGWKGWDDPCRIGHGGAAGNHLKDKLNVLIGIALVLVVVGRQLNIIW